jgi:hypothetical protein
MAGKTKKSKDRKASSEKGTKKAAKKMAKGAKGSKIEYFNKFPFFCIATFNAPRSAQNCSPVDMRGFMQDDVQQ